MLHRQSGVMLRVIHTRSGSAGHHERGPFSRRPLTPFPRSSPSDMTSSTSQHIDAAVDPLASLHLVETLTDDAITTGPERGGSPARPPCRVLDLPNEILAAIIELSSWDGRLDFYRGRLSAQFWVCTRWKAVSESLFYRELALWTDVRPLPYPSPSVSPRSHLG